MKKDGYQLLADAIVQQAMEDWRMAEDEEDLEELEEFFRSEWFRVLSKADPEKIIRDLRKENEQDGR